MRSRVLEFYGGRRKYVLVLEPGEEVVASVKRFAEQEGLTGASVQGIGALSHSELGYFNPTTKEFVSNKIDEQTEVLSLLGNIAQDCEDNVKLHIHIVLGCRDATTRGGHLVAGYVNPTAELIIEESEEHLRRGVDAPTGLVLLEPRGKEEA